MQDTSGPGFKGNYAGNQDASKGIIGMLEVVRPSVWTRRA
jgi:hypothetical protein